MNNLPINIIVVDDHQMVLEGMRSILERFSIVKLIATVASANEALLVLRESIVHIAFVDINMPEISGMELCSKIKKEFPNVHVIALSTFQQRSYVSEMLKNGASGYLLKSADKEEIEEAILSVIVGKIYLSHSINNAINEQSNTYEPPTLTRREKEVLQFISEGLTNNDIANKIFISTYTVDTHRKNLLSKFEVNNTALLIKKAALFGLL